MFLKLKRVDTFLYGKDLLVLENVTTFVKNFQIGISSPFSLYFGQNAAEGCPHFGLDEQGLRLCRCKFVFTHLYIYYDDRQGAYRRNHQGEASHQC